MGYLVLDTATGERCRHRCLPRSGHRGIAGRMQGGAWHGFDHVESARAPCPLTNRLVTSCPYRLPGMKTQESRW